jgi:hypothetical protein
MDNLLQQTIKNIVSRIDAIENELEKHKKRITANALDALDPKLYIKGKFVHFHEENQALEILVNGEHRYYPLNTYYSSYIPFPDSTAIIFSEINSDGNSPKIMAISQGEVQKFANYHYFIFKGIKKTQAIFYSKFLGYLYLLTPLAVLENHTIKVDDKVKFREINYGVVKYFIPEIDTNVVKQNRLAILQNF